MEKKVCLTKKEILENPNDITLGKLVRERYWEEEKKDNQKDQQNDTEGGENIPE